MARVSREGRLIEAPRALLNHDATVSAVASNGTHVLVAYYRSAGSTQDKRAMMVDRSGNIVTDVLIDPGFGVQFPLSAASDGDSFVVVWLDGSRFMVTRLSSRGLWLAQRELLTGSFADETALAYGGGQYALVVRSNQKLQAIAFDPQTLQPSMPVELDGVSSKPAIVFNGSEFVVLWSGSSGARSARIEPHLSTPRSIMSVNELPAMQSPFAASNGRNLFIVWMASNDVAGALLDLRGESAVTRPALVALAPVTQVEPMLATSGDESYAVWMERTSETSGRIMAARIDFDGTVATPLMVAGNAWIVVPPQIVFTGSSYFVAWVFISDSELRVAGRLLGRDGSLGAEIQFGSGSMPGLASNGAITLIAFTRSQDIVGVRLNENGVPIDTTPLVIAASRRANQSPGQPFPLSVSSNGSDFLVAWNEGSDYWQFPSPGWRDIYGVRVMSSGSFDAAPIAIATGGSNQYAPAVASDGRDYVVAYEINGMMAGLFRRDGQIAAKRVLREGQVAGLAGDVDGVVFADGRTPDVARDGSGYVVAFHSMEGLRVVQLDANASERSRVMVPMPGAGGAAVLAQANRTVLVYTRLHGEPGIGAAQRAFVRIGSETGPRRRSARH